MQGGKKFQNETIVMDPKRKRVAVDTDLEENGPGLQIVNEQQNRPKNLLKAGPAVQAYLDQ